MLQTKVVEKMKIQILCSITFFLSKIVPFARYGETYCTAGLDTEDNMVHTHCMLDNEGYKYTHWLCNIHCFSLQQWWNERAAV